MKRLVITCIAIFILLQAVYAASIGYPYENSLTVDDNLVEALRDMGHDVETYKTGTRLTAQFDILLIGDEHFRSDPGIGERPAIVVNHYNILDWGLVDEHGISQLISSQPLKVSLPSGEIVTVYTLGKDLRGIGIPYYYLSNPNKIDNAITLASTVQSVSGNNHAGDVVTIIPKGAPLEGGEFLGENICFFGITQTRYWTAAAEQLFADCVTQVYTDQGPLDIDDDGILDDIDNCLGVYNPGQEDLDDDGIGDLCDTDRDGDGVNDIIDNCPVTSNPTQSDADGDGTGDACEDPCADGIDNDADGLIDNIDPGCGLGDESLATSECQDGIDNDLDGAIDLEDPFCDSLQGMSEGTEDTTPPLMTIISPQSGTHYSSELMLEIVVIDESPVICWYEIDDGDMTFFECTEKVAMSIGSGAHSLTIGATDSRNNSVQESRNVTIEAFSLTNITITPELTDLSHDYSQRTAILDFKSSMFPLNASIRIDSGSTTISILKETIIISQSDMPLNYTVPSGLAPGSYQIILKATDNFNRTTESVLDSFTVLAAPVEIVPQRSSGGGGGSALISGGGTLIAECNNSIDDDGDGLIDLKDPGCEDFGDFNETDPPTCDEKWLCEDWEACSQGIARRECQDLRDCGTEIHKPTVLKGCSDLTTAKTEAPNDVNEAESTELEQSGMTSITGEVVGSGSEGCSAWGFDLGAAGGICWYVHLMIYAGLFTAILLIAWKMS